jgi:hypothetical protein
MSECRPAADPSLCAERSHIAPNARLHNGTILHWLAAQGVSERSIPDQGELLIASYPNADYLGVVCGSHSILVKPACTGSREVHS